MSTLPPRRQRAASAAAIILVALLAVGCTGDPSPSASPSAEPLPSYVPTYVAPPPTELAPLRGTTVPAGATAHPSIAAKIDNHWDARPQAGLELSDVVYEELVEGGITRYVAIWQSTIPELLGPVRSIRPMDPDIVSPHHGIIAYSGGQTRFVSLMQRTPVYNAIHGSADTKNTFFRAKGRKGPHDVLVKAQEVVAQHPELAAPAQQWAFALDAGASTAAKEGSPTAAINYRFSRLYYGTWTYDAESARYWRVQQGNPDLDSNGAQLNATNIVLLRVQVVNDGGVPKTVLEGSGEAWVSTGGGTVHGTWTKPSMTEPLQLVDNNGFTIQLGAGNTWVELLPPQGGVDFVAL